MIRFNVNGEYLDMPADFGLQFKKSNILFAFDNIECERSTSFDIPATPQNNRIFALAKWVQTDGVGMRRKYAAQMQDGVVVQDGYLHIDAFNKGKYKAVFVTGELLGLKRIKDAGKIGDVISPTTTTTFGSNSTPYIARLIDFAGVIYNANGGDIFPSVRLHGIISSAMAALGVPYAAPVAAQYVRYIPQEVSGVKNETVTFSAISRQGSTTTYPVVYEIDMTAATEVLQKTTARVRFEERATGGAVVSRRGLVQQYTARQPLQITFPSNWNDNLFIGYFVNGDSPLVTEFSFYGDRAFDDSGSVTGESLRGRTVDIARGASFVIIDKGCFVNQPYSGGTLYGWSFVDTECDIEIEGGEMEMFSVVRLADNLPDATVTELLKIIAAISGRVLYYEDGAGVSFDELSFGTWGVFDLSGKVISLSNIQRRFGDFERRNIIDFSSGESVPQSSRIITEYTVDNDNLQDEKTLMNIKYSEGASAGMYGARTFAQVPNGTAALADANVPSNVDGGMFRVQLLKNAGLQALCDASTSVQVQARMTYLEFTQIKPKTLLFYDGVRYVWTEAQWSKGIASFNSSKIPA